MQNEIVLRELRKQDYAPLQKIVCDTWGFEQFCSEKIAANLSRAYLCSCLTDQTFIRVAEVDGKTAGIIMGKNIRRHRIPFKHLFRSLCATVCLMVSAEGRAALKLFGDIESIDTGLLEESKKDYEGELSFFIVDAAYRGKGLGKALFESFMQYVEVEKIRSFYLYTDTDCNFGFYERNGLTRKAEKKHTFQFDDITYDMSFFIYEYEKKCGFSACANQSDNRVELVKHYGQEKVDEVL